MTNQTFDLISTDKNLNPETQIALIMAQCQYRLELLVQRPRFLQFIPLGMVGKRSKMMQIRVSKSSRRKVSLRKSQKSFDEVVYHSHRINVQIINLNLNILFRSFIKKIENKRIMKFRFDTSLEDLKPHISQTCVLYAVVKGLLYRGI